MNGDGATSLAQRRTVTAAICVALFLAAAEATVVATAMPTIVASLGGLRFYGWVGSTYFAAATLVTPLSGRLADMHGRKPVMMAGLALFVAGSALCGVAPTMPALLVGRVLQGLGAGVLAPTALTIVGDLYEPSERGRVQAAFSAIYGVSAIAGPALGAVIVEHASWRWVFLINVPIGIASATLLTSFRDRTPSGDRRYDIAGALALGFALTALLLALDHVGPSLFGVAAAFFTVFLVHSRRTKDPLLPIDLLRAPAVAISVIGAGMASASSAATVMFVPLYVQQVLRGSPRDAGVALVPMLLAAPLGSFASGRLVANRGFRPLVIGGAAIAFGSAVALAWTVRRASSIAWLCPCLFFLAFGLSLANTSLLVAVQNAVDWSRRGVATALIVFSRNLGGALLLAALGGWIGDLLPRAFAALAFVGGAAFVVAWFFPRANEATASGR